MCVVRRALAGSLVLFAWLALADDGARAQAPSPNVVPAEAAPPVQPLAPAAAPYAPPTAPPPSYPEPYDDVLRRLLRSSCRDGLPEARALAASGGASWAATVTRLCGEILVRQTTAPPRLVGGRRDQRDGRGTLVAWSTIYGIWAGIAMDVMLSIDNARVAILPPLAGMGVGLALSLGLTADHPVTNGEAWAIATGLEYGSFNGAFWAGGFNFAARSVVTTAFATGVVGGAAGLLVASQRSPRQGDVEVARSGLLWGTVAGLLGMALVSPDASSESFLRGAAVSMDLGFLAGLALAASFDVSRNRDLIIDAGTLGGGVAGLGVAVLAMGTNGSGQTVAGGTLAGMFVGMAMSIYLTRDLDDDDGEPGSNVAALLGRDERGRWRWGTPGPTPVFDGLGRRVVGATFTAVGGTF